MSRLLSGNEARYSSTCPLMSAAATRAQTLKVFLAFALPVETLKLPSVPMMASSTRSTTGGMVSWSLTRIKEFSTLLLDQAVAVWLQLDGSFASSYFSPCEFESKFWINDDFSTNLRDGSIDFSALFDTISRGQTTPKEASESSKPIDKMFLFFGGGFYCDLSLIVRFSVLCQK